MLRSSRRSAYAEVDIWSAGKLAARASTTYMIKPLAEMRPVRTHERGRRARSPGSPCSSSGQIYNGPYCGLLLAHHGAEVIKVEAPQGDVLRRMDRSPGGASYPFLMLNANKRGVRIDLKQPRGRELFLRLAERADVLVENFAAGVVERLGIGYEAVRARNPRLVYASGSGFGSSGPYVGYPAMDFTIQALVGAMSITGYPDQPPVKCGPTFIDMLGADAPLRAASCWRCASASAAGVGQRVEVAMFDAAVPALLSYLAPFYELQREMSRSGNRHVVGGATPYNNFPCTRRLRRHPLRLRPALARSLRRHGAARPARRRALAQRRRAAPRTRERSKPRSSAWTAPQTRADVARTVAGAGIPSAPVRTISEVGSDPHLFERAVVREVESPPRGTGEGARHADQVSGCPAAVTPPGHRADPMRSVDELAAALDRTRARGDRALTLPRATRAMRLNSSPRAFSSSGEPIEQRRLARISSTRCRRSAMSCFISRSTASAVASLYSRRAVRHSRLVAEERRRGGARRSVGPSVVAHAVLDDHRADDVGGALQVVVRAGRHLAEHHLLRGAAAEQHVDFAEQLLAWSSDSGRRSAAAACSRARRCRAG